MKKIITLILAATTVLTATFALTSCASETGNEGDASSTKAAESTKAPESVFPQALSKVKAYVGPELSSTGWELTGGMVDGVEMNEDDLCSVLDAYGGGLQLIFVDGKNATFISGEGSIEGNYAVVQDGCAIHAFFGSNEYFGVFTIVEDEYVLVITNGNDSEVALYMTPCGEK